MSNKNIYSERLSVSFTPEQMRRIEEILRVRAKQGRMQHKADVMREAMNLFISYQDDIPGTRAAITRKLEGRMEAIERQLEQTNENLLLLDENLQQHSKLIEQLVAFFIKKKQDKEKRDGS